jgi:hypothetical protein
MRVFGRCFCGGCRECGASDPTDCARCGATLRGEDVEAGECWSCRTACNTHHEPRNNDGSCDACDLASLDALIAARAAADVAHMLAADSAVAA